MMSVENSQVGERNLMGISEHVSAEMLSDLIGGELSPGLALAVCAHLDLCRTCCDVARAAGLPEKAKPEPEPVLATPQPGALSRTPSLRSLTLGRKQRIGKGLAHSPVLGVSGLGESVHLVEISPGAPLDLPVSGEWLLILNGSLQTRRATYGCGDFLGRSGGLLDGALAGGSGCDCLVVGDEELYGHHFFEGLLGRRH
jgi:putative transcriptional regulator